VRWWKWLGLAGVAGVTATGIVVAQAERRRRAYTPGEVRDRLHARLEEAAGDQPSGPDEPAAPPVTDGAAVPGRRHARAKLAKLLRRSRGIRHPEFDRQ